MRRRAIIRAHTERVPTIDVILFNYLFRLIYRLGGPSTEDFRGEHLRNGDHRRPHAGDGLTEVRRGP